MCDPCCLPMCCPEPICCPMPSCCPSPCEPCYPMPSCCPPSCSPCPPQCCPPPSCGPCPPPCCPPKRCKSRELVASVLMTKCECTQRNGLQLDCPRTECRGRPLCSTKPIPSCCPSKFNYRFSNVTMGKPAFAVPKKKKSCPKSNICNPCVVGCDPPSCDPCCKSC